MNHSTHPEIYTDCGNGLIVIDLVKVQKIIQERDKLKEQLLNYQWLRDGNAYAPEEECVRGGEELDRLCADGRSGKLYGSGVWVPPVED